jgi:hypothetical protein
MTSLEGCDYAVPDQRQCRSSSWRWSRHPEFLQKAGLFFAGQGFDIIDDPDLPQLQRVKSLEDTFEVLAH